MQNKADTYKILLLFSLKNENIIQQISSLHGKAITWQYRRVNMQIENMKISRLENVSKYTIRLTSKHIIQYLIFIL